jgi:integrase
MAKGWLRRKKGKLLFCWYNASGKERSRVIGPDTIAGIEAGKWVGELGLDKLVAQPDPTNMKVNRIAFGELAEKYLAQHPFNKPSTKELHEQIVRNLLIPRWSEAIAIEIDPRELKTFMVGLDVESSTRGKYRSVMSGVYNWGQCEGLIPRGEQFNPCRYVKGWEFSQVTEYEAMALEIEDIFKILSKLKRPEYELTLTVVACMLRISEVLGLKWKDILWNRGLIAIRRTFVHLNMQQGAKTRLSRSRVEAPQLLLDALAAWRKETTYVSDEDFVFPSEKLGGKQPRSGSMLVEDYLRPAAIAAGVIIVKDGITYDRDGEVVKRFGFHVLGRHSIATFLVDEQQNPAVVQAVMRHATMDMTLYYSHSRRKAKRAAQDKVMEKLIPDAALQDKLRVPVRVPRMVQ